MSVFAAFHLDGIDILEEKLPAFIIYLTQELEKLEENSEEPGTAVGPAAISFQWAKPADKQ